ncbi:MAG TPA: phosphoribosyltransferase family protein, partial [Bacteroidaceae bacterium]|nr:phosphoribosyltransferase family protein [Bacteroidaceae bacterium]
DSITRTISNTSQTKKGRFQRWKNSEGIFQINSTSQLKGKHILIVDDVITTGATITSLVETITESVQVQISIFTLALSE